MLLICFYIVEFLFTSAKCLFDSSWFVRKMACEFTASTIEHMITLSADRESEESVDFYRLSCQDNVFAFDIIRNVLKIAATHLFFDINQQMYDNEDLSNSLAFIEHLNFSFVSFWCTVSETTPQILVSRVLLLMKYAAENLQQSHELILLNVLKQMYESDLCRHEIQQQIIPFVWSLLERCNILFAINISSWALTW